MGGAPAEAGLSGGGDQVSQAGVSVATRQFQTYCAMCASRCGVLATVQDGVLTKVNADPSHPNGCICIKGTAAPEIVYSPDRLQYPMVRTRPKGDPDPGWRRISWDEALELTTSRLLDIKARCGAESVVFSRATPAGSASSDFEGWLVRLANAFGSPNVLTTTHICTWNRGYGSKYTYGVATPTPDYEHARCMLLWGYNPQVSEPAAAMRISKAQARGAKLIVIDPRRNSLAEKADLWLKVRPGSDGALALAMIRVLLDEGLYDAGFVRHWTNGILLVREDTRRLLTERDLAPAGDPETFVVWDGGTDAPARYHPEQGCAHDGVIPELTGSFAITLVDGGTVTCHPAFQLLSDLAAEYAPELSEALTWVPAGDVRQAARLFAMEKPSCYASWVGLEQHTSAMQTNRAVCVFYALTGQFDKRGSNVLFAGVPVQPITGSNLLPAQQAARRLGLGEHPLGPQRDPGVVQAADVYRAALTSQPYPVKAMVLFGSDPLLGQGDPMQGKAALEQLDFYVHMDMFVNPSALFADVLLPASTCWEHEALMPGFRKAENAATWAQFREAVVQPLHEARSDLEVIFDLATRMGMGNEFFGGDIEAAFNYELAPSGLTVQQLRDQPGGVRAPGKTRYQKYAEINPETGRPRGFQTPTRKLEIYATAFARAGYAALPVREGPVKSHAAPSSTAEHFPLVLTFARLLPFVDEQHRNIPRLRRQAPHPSLEIHPSTAAALHVQNGEWVLLETATGTVQLMANFNPFLDSRVVATQYGWWQRCRDLDLPGYDPFGPEGANANRLISNEAVDPISGSVQHRSVKCRVRKKNPIASTAEAWTDARPNAD